MIFKFKFTQFPACLQQQRDGSMTCVRPPQRLKPLHDATNKANMAPWPAPHCEAKLEQLLRLHYGQTPPSLFVADKLRHLLKFPLRKYKLPQSYNDTVQFDPIHPLSLLVPCKPHRPFILRLQGRKCAIVIGYRELYDKRQRITYLRWQAGLDFYENNPGHAEHDGCCHSYFESAFNLARGGGQKSKSSSAEKKGRRRREKGKKQDGDGSKKIGGSSSSKKSKSPATSQKKSRPGSKKSKKRKKKERSRSGKKIKEKRRVAKSEAPTPTVQVPAERQKDVPLKRAPSYSSNLPDDLPDQASKKLERELDREMESSRGRTSMVIATDMIEIPVIEAHFLKQNIPEVEEEWSEITGLSRRPSSLIDEARLVSLAPIEKDSEWLSYSSTDSAEVQERDEADQLFKQREPWMLRGITFESQNLVDGLGWFLLSSKLTGRSSFYTRPDYLENIIVFVVDRGKELIFLITSTIVWLCFVLIAQAAIDILLVGGSSDYATKERNAVERYAIPCLYVIGELAIVAVWSVFLLLKYSLRVAHYINVWCTSASEMEVNLATGIVYNTAGNHLFFLLYTICITTSFALGIPKNIRASMGVLTALLIRNFVPQVLEARAELLLILQIFGLCLHIYIMYCARITTNLVHIMCIILKNASELWNLKFALRAGQIPIGKSGYLRHMKLRQTYTKAWQHHRLLTGLCVELGNVFAAPVALNFLSRLSVVVLCMVDLFQQAYITKSRRKLIEDQERFSNEELPTQLEDVVTVLFILLYVTFDFIVNATYLDAAGQAFRDGYEFVRRKGFLLCANSRERRLIQSLQWSFSATKANLVNLKGFFPVDKETMLNFLSIALLLWSLIIQLQAEGPGVVIVFTPNCLQQPNGRYLHERDPEGFCRKKVWTVESNVVPRTTVIIEKLNYLTSDLESKERRRRRRRRRSVQDSQDVTRIIHWKAAMTYSHAGYEEGNCLRPKSGNFSLYSYYAHFHEPCHSRVLNMTFLVPKLFFRRKKVWLGRSSVDCGVFPFPLPTLYDRDCDGNGIATIAKKKARDSYYDDCGWRKSAVDDVAFAFSAGNNGTVLKVKFTTPDGHVFWCWNIFYAIQRCRTIAALPRGSSKLCAMSRNLSQLEDPKMALKLLYRNEPTFFNNY